MTEYIHENKCVRMRVRDCVQLCSDRWRVVRSHPSVPVVCTAVAVLGVLVARFGLAHDKQSHA